MTAALGRQQLYARTHTYTLVAISDMYLQVYVCVCCFLHKYISNASKFQTVNESNIFICKMQTFHWPTEMCQRQSQQLSEVISINVRVVEITNATKTIMNELTFRKIHNTYKLGLKDLVLRQYIYLYTYKHMYVCMHVF